MNHTIILLVCGYTGLICHFLKKKIKGETVTEIKTYFHDNIKSTLLALITVAVGIYFLNDYAALTYAEAFGIGYMVDSILNKWEPAQ